MTALLLALQLAALPAPQPEAGRQPADRAWNAAEHAIVAFLTEWAEAWQRTEAGKAALAGEEGLQREAAVHCHWPPSAEDDFPEHNEVIGRVAIASHARAHLSCPLWYPAAAGAVQDEGNGLDAGLARVLRGTVRLHREDLMRELRAAAKRSPRDVRLTGQLVRFALDAGDLGQAWKVVESCQGDQVRCQLLRGLVLYRRRQVPEADSIFLAAARTMPERERCAWNDVGVLLAAELRPAYWATSCADRAELETRLWWLADPLYHEPGNERRAEHFARQVMVSLLTQFPGDGRQHFARAAGGEAVIETLIRYGWPAHIHWGGIEADKGHSQWLLQRGVEPATPYVVREYSRGRLHTLPPPAVLASPFTAAADQWQLNDPGNELLWWPVEHFARDRSRIVQLDGQSGSLRRAKATRFVWAGTLDSASLARPDGASVRAGLYAWRSATDGRPPAEYEGLVGGRLLIDTVLEPGDVLIGVELPGDQTVPAARTRFGTHIAEPLGSLPARARALSEPLLFDPPPDDTATISANEAVARMYASSSLPPDSRIGVYWEGYGFAASDTIDVGLQVTGQDAGGSLAGSGAAGGGEAARGGASLRWRDVPGTTRGIQTNEGGTPVQMRNVILSLAGLASGSYRLTISMTSQGAGRVTSERTFVVR